MIKKLLIFAALFLLPPALAMAGFWDFFTLGGEEPTLGAPDTSFQRNLFPFEDSTYELGTSTKAWLRINVDEVCLTGDSCETSWPSGSGGSGSVGTSSTPVIGNLSFWTTSGANTELLGTVATSSVTINAPLTSAGTAGAVVGGSGWTIDIDDIKAADLDLTDITLNDFTNDANFLVNTRALTVVGTANQITSSAGSQDLSADRTWTLSLPSHVVFPTSYQASLGSTTNATSTNFDITSLLTFNGVTGDEWTDFCATITGHADLCDGNDASGAGGASFGQAWEIDGSGNLAPTTTALTISIPSGNLLLQDWSVSTTTTVCLVGGCEYTSIQSALNDGHTYVRIKNGTYSEQLFILNSKTVLDFESRNAKVQCNGATQSPCISATTTDELVILNGTGQETNVTPNGIYLDASNMSYLYIDGHRINNFATSTYGHDTDSTQFYWHLENMVMIEPISCVDLGGSQANANTFESIRCRPLGIDGGNGIYLEDTRGITLNAIDVEGTTTAFTNKGIYVATTSRETTINNSWMEALGTGLFIDTGANRTTVIGSSITSNGTDITDNGTNSVFLNTSDTGVLTTKLGNATSTSFAITDITSALGLFGADGSVNEYPGTTCTNQFARALDALGVATCATVGTADVSGLDISADTNLAVTFPIVLTDDTLSLGFGTTTDNTWSGHNIFLSLFATLASSTHATSTNLDVTSTFTFGGDIFDELVGLGLDLSSGDLVFDCSDVEGTGINCTGEAITLDATGDWTGTLDTYNGSALAVLAENEVVTGQYAFSNVGTTTFSGGVESGVAFGAPFLFATSTTASSTFAGGIISNILGCSEALETDAGGNIICGTDVSGGSSVGQSWEFLSDAKFLAPTTTTAVVIGTTTAPTTLNALTVTATSSDTLNLINLFDANTTSQFSVSTAGALTLGTDLTVANGGTGASTLTGLLQGNGTSAFTAITDSSTVGQVLRVTGASTYAWGALDLTDGDAITGALGAANGGTGLSSLGAGVATFLGTPSAANLQSAVSGTTGTAGSLVFSIAPTFTGTSTFSGIDASGGIDLTSIISCSEALETDSSGSIICGTDADSGGGGHGASWELLSDANYLAPTTTIGAVVGTTTAPSTNVVLRGTATSTDTDVLFDLLDDTNDSLFSLTDDALLRVGSTTGDGGDFMYFDPQGDPVGNVAFSVGEESCIRTFCVTSAGTPSFEIKTSGTSAETDATLRFSGYSAVGTDGGDVGSLIFVNSNGTASLAEMAVIHQNASGNNGGTLTFDLSHPDNGLTEVMRLVGGDTTNPFGAVGISTSTPFEQLTVQGNAFIGGNLTATGTISLQTSGSVLDFAGGDITFTHGSNLLTFAGGAMDFSAATIFEIPNSTNPTIDTSGELGVDTTSGQLLYYDGVEVNTLTGHLYPAFSYATSTAWTGTTTIELGPAFVGETWNGVQCLTDTGTLDVIFSDNSSTNDMDTVVGASTTAGTVVFTANNTYTSAERRIVEVGNPASTPTKIACTVDKAIARD